MKTLNYTIDEILESIYAASAVMHLGARNNDRQPAIMHRDHAKALSRVVADAASVVVEWMEPAGVVDVSVDREADTIVFTLDDDADSGPLRHTIANALRLISMHIVYAAAGISNDFITIARMCTGTLARRHRPARMRLHEI